MGDSRNGASPIRGLLARFAAAALVVSGVASAGTLVVAPAPGPGVDFTTIQAAVAAAADGDTILVSSGTYAESVALGNKGLTLVGRGSPAPTCRRLSIHDVPAGKSVRVRGFRLRSVGLPTAPPLAIRDCAGAVLVEECDGAYQGVTGDGDPAGNVSNSGEVALVRCTLTGVDGSISDIGFGTPGGDGGAGLRAAAAGVALHACIVVGGDGGLGDEVPGGDGGPAVRGEGGRVRVFRGALTGGDGGFASIPGQHGSGGSAADLDPAAIFEYQDSSLIPGKSGSFPPVAAPMFVGGSVFTVPGIAALLDADAPLAAGATATVRITGAPTSAAMLLVGTGLDLANVGGALAPLAVQVPLILLPAGSLNAAGTLDLVAAVPALPPGVESAAIVLQALVVVPAGTPAFTNATQFVALAPGV